MNKYDYGLQAKVLRVLLRAKRCGSGPLFLADIARQVHTNIQSANSAVHSLKSRGAVTAENRLIPYSRSDTATARAWRVT